jgi:hypothetical protein
MLKLFVVEKDEEEISEVAVFVAAEAVKCGELFEFTGGDSLT